MTNQEVVDYVINTPNNTNPVILKQMLKDIAGSGNLELDTTLSVAGKAADAKAVGDAIGRISSGNVDLGVTGATIGQTVKIAKVDENGVPTAWESVDFPSSGGSGAYYEQPEVPEDAPVGSLWYDTDEEPPENSGGIIVTGAKVGQTVKISAVDENGVPTAWESVDFPSGGDEVKEWEEFMRFTTDNNETTVFDFSSNGVETLESKRVKEIYIYSPMASYTGSTAIALINNRLSLTLTDFGRGNGGYLRFYLGIHDGEAIVNYYGRDTAGGLCTGNLNLTNVSESNGLINASLPKTAHTKISDVLNGIPIPTSPIDYIKTITFTMTSACGSGVEFIVYVR